MPTSGLFKILSVDMSLRAAGVCLMEYDGSVRIREALCLETTKADGSRFNGLELDAFQLHKSMTAIKEIEKEYKPNAVLVEFPYISQNARAGIAIGMCWGAWIQHFAKEHFIAIEPSALKVWSNSKKGDHKSKVKHKVLSRVLLPTNKQNDDNIVDAIGLSLLFLDLYHEYTLPKTNQRQSSPAPFRLDE